MGRVTVPGLEDDKETATAEDVSHTSQGEVHLYYTRSVKEWFPHGGAWS